MIYEVSDRFSTDIFNYVIYKCNFIYFDIDKNSYVFDKNIDNAIFDELVKIDIQNSAHQMDVFLYKSLLNSMFFFINNNFIFMDEELKNHFYFISGKKK